VLNASGIHQGQGFGQWPAAFESERQRGWRDANSRRPCFEHHRFAIEGDEPCAGTIAGLLTSGGPSAVFWRVVAIVVDPVDRAVCWLGAHVCQKVFKALRPTPSVADLNAAPTVSVEKPIGGVAASVLHSRPNAIGRAFGHAVLAGRASAAARNLFEPLEKSRGHADGFSTVAHAFPHAPCLSPGAPAAEKAPRYKHVKSLASQIFASVKRFFGALATARSGASASEVVGCASDLIPAVTQAEPGWLARRVSSGRRLCDEAAETLVCEVDRCCHADSVKTIRDTQCNHLIGARQPWLIWS